MPRLRTIRPNFAQIPAVGRLSRDARLLFIEMWTVADDAGRLRFVPDLLVEQLFPFDTDALMLLPSWLDELERERLIERYSIEDADYLRVLHWRRLQSIDRPTRSRLPASPSESLASREAREAREESPETSQDWASSGDPREDFLGDEAGVLGGPREITPARVLVDLDRLQRKAEATESHTAAARYTELMGRHVGLWPGRERGKGPHRQDAAGDGKEPAGSRSPSPAELHGLPETRASD